MQGQQENSDRQRSEDERQKKKSKTVLNTLVCRLHVRDCAVNNWKRGRPMEIKGRMSFILKIYSPSEDDVVYVFFRSEKL